MIIRHYNYKFNKTTKFHLWHYRTTNSPLILLERFATGEICFWQGTHKLHNWHITLQESYHEERPKDCSFGAVAFLIITKCLTLFIKQEIGVSVNIVPLFNPTGFNPVSTQTVHHGCNMLMVQWITPRNHQCIRLYAY
jgi:hypothetical protein